MSTFELPKEWIVKAVEVLGEVSQILSLVKKTAEDIERIEVEIRDVKNKVSEIKARAKALTDQIPPNWIKLFQR